MAPAGCVSIRLTMSNLPYLLILLHLAAQPMNSQELDSTSLVKVIYNVGADKLRMAVNETRQVSVELQFDKQIVDLQRVERIEGQFVAKTLSPQFDIVRFSDESNFWSVGKVQLQNSGYNHRLKLTIHADYIGHALISLRDASLKGPNKSGKAGLLGSESLEVTVTQYEGIWDTVFIVSVVVFIIVSYINLGAQLDRENINEMLRKPGTVLFGFLITVLVMPLLAWSVGLWIMGDHVNYRIGFFVFACGPAASASTLWTVMLNCDKELSVGLQVVSTVGALVSMPVLLYLMEVSMGLEVKDIYMTRVPYGKLLQTLLTLLIALLIGWHFIGRHEKAQKISRTIFRPLTFFVLIYIIVFSSIVYWHIYKMFDWQITLASSLIAALTYIISGILGYLANFRKGGVEQAVAISIGSAYKNSGIAFAVLMVIFEKPDNFIAYVPCLTQVVVTSLMLYSTYCITNLVKYVRRRNQVQPVVSPKLHEDSGIDRRDELVPMNVTDIENGQPDDRRRSS